jgi:hypothetical protein
MSCRVRTIDNSFMYDKPTNYIQKEDDRDDESILPWSNLHARLTRCTRHSETRHGYVVRLPHEKNRRHTETAASFRTLENQDRWVVQKTWKIYLVDDLIGYDSSIAGFRATLLATNSPHALSHGPQTCVRPYLSLRAATVALGACEERIGEGLLKACSDRSSAGTSSSHGRCVACTTRRGSARDRGRSRRGERSRT